MRAETLHVQPPAPDPAEFDALSVPVHRASTVVFSSAEAFASRHERLYDGYSYGLYGTPTSRALEVQIAALEGATRALVLPSGLSAIVLACLGVTKAGDRILMPHSMYGPARAFAERLLGPLGVEMAGYSALAQSASDLPLDERTRVIWVESPGSVTFEVQDVDAIVRAAKQAGALVAVNNTWATPVLFNPLAHGADISMQSLSKYASGHSDLLMGSLAVRDEQIFRRLKDTARLLGLGVSSDDCFLCARGLKTLPVRLRQAAQAATDIMLAIESHPAVLRILHPSRPNHPGHRIWTRDFLGSNGLFSLVLAPTAESSLRKAFQSLRYFKIGASWGATTSLIAPSNPRLDRPDLGWLPDGQVVRVSVGLEDVSDLIDDLTNFLSAVVEGMPSRTAVSSAHPPKQNNPEV